MQRRFGERPFVARHDLNALDLFCDEALIELLDRHPRDLLYALSMGTDPTRAEENRRADTSGVSGRDLLDAVKRGRLWLNVTRVNRAHPHLRALIDGLYHALHLALPGFRPTDAQGTLLVSSANAQVYYHVDGPPSVLWHLRGRKRLYVYPARDERFVSRAIVEEIFAGVRHEYVPYRRELDLEATCFDLEPGMVAFWPQNAPHRVENLEGLNVSLATEHFTEESRARARVYVANRFLRNTFGFRRLDDRTEGPSAFAKTLVHRVVRACRLDPTRKKRQRPTLRVEPSAPLGVVELEREQRRSA